MICRIETQISASKDSDALWETVSKTRKVLLVAVYARVLRQANVPAEVVDQLVISSSSKKVTRSDIVKLILKRVSGGAEAQCLAVTPI